MDYKKLILTALAFANWNLSASAENIKELSLVPFETCKKPPVSPSPKLFKRSYKTYIYAGSWAILDINGDGWCDWVRGGNEGYRSDQEYPPMREFIYLGTAKGWRHFDQPEIKHGEIDGWGQGEITLISGDYAALNFFQPIAIYSKGITKPYIAAVIRYDAPAPAPDRENINVFQWSDSLDKLHKVPEKERIAIIDFLHDKLCKDKPELMADGDSPFLLAQGDLCFAKK